MHLSMFSLLAARDTTTRYEIPSAAVSRSSLRIRFDNLTSIPSGRPPLYHRPEFRTIPGRVKVLPDLLAVYPRNRARHSFIDSIDEAHGMRLPSGFSSHVFSLGFEPLKTAGMRIKWRSPFWRRPPLARGCAPDFPAGGASGSRRAKGI